MQTLPLRYLVSPELEREIEKSIEDGDIAFWMGPQLIRPRLISIVQTEHEAIVTLKRPGKNGALLAYTIDPVTGRLVPRSYRE